MRKVLLVDNEPFILEGLLQLIDWTAEGCEVIGSALNGVQALEIISHQAIDIVVTDIRMPEMDGLALCERIRAKYPLMQLVILTGFPDFEYAQAAIKYGVADFILKPTTEEALIGAIRKSIQNIGLYRNVEEQQKNLFLQQQVILQDLLYGSEHSLIWVLNRMAEARLVITEYIILSIRLYGQENAREEMTMMADFIQRAKRIAERNDETMYPVEKDDDRCYLVVPGSEAYGRVFCKHLADEIENEADYLVRIGISRRYQSVVEMKRAAEEAEDARRFILYESQSSVMEYDNLPDLTTEIKAQLVEKMRQTENALENRNESRLNESLDELFIYMQENAIPYSTMLNIVRLFRNYGNAFMLSHNLLEEEPETGFTGEETPEHLKQQIRKQLESVMNRLKEEHNSDDSAISEICDYIDLHYKEPLTLEVLAEMAHLSPGYFSRLFKRRKGINFGNYIVHCRMEKAKELLAGTDKKIYEISDEVGIDDPVYFSRLFKKYTGLKPKEFRENVKN